MTATTTRILITAGEPAGIGPDIAIRIAQQTWPIELVIISDPQLLTERAKAIGLPLQLNECKLGEIPHPNKPSTLKIIPIPLAEMAYAGKLNVANAPYVIETLELAASLCQKKSASALVTGPVHKGIINKAGIPFIGHTEFFAHFCGIPQTVMLFVVDHLKIALQTTHIPLAHVSKAITKETLRSTLSILNQSLKTYFNIKTPRILICGLNPHAGENGFLGMEEIETIIPLINELVKQDFCLEGPFPADTIFTPSLLKRADAILAMYHDQALPLVKYIGFGHAVNVTLGLPFIRTSVDHGTALDIAGTNKADPGSLVAAIQLAIRLISV